MKIILSGHTSPIGKLLYNHFKSHNLTLLHYSYGWDLSNHTVCKNISYLDADVFLNCAHVGECQGTLLDYSKARININFGSQLTKFSWDLMKNYASIDYLKEKLYLEHIHYFKKNSALLRIMSYGNGVIPSVTDNQILYVVDEIVNERAILPTTYDISNGLGNFTGLEFQTR